MSSLVLRRLLPYLPTFLVACGLVWLTWDYADTKHSLKTTTQELEQAQADYVRLRAFNELRDTLDTELIQQRQAIHQQTQAFHDKLQTNGSHDLDPGVKRLLNDALTNRQAGNP